MYIADDIKWPLIVFRAKSANAHDETMHLLWGAQHDDLLKAFVTKHMQSVLQQLAMFREHSGGGTASALTI